MCCFLLLYYWIYLDVFLEDFHLLIFFIRMPLGKMKGRCSSIITSTNSEMRHNVSSIKQQSSRILLHFHVGVSTICAPLTFRMTDLICIIKCQIGITQDSNVCLHDIKHFKLPIVNLMCFNTLWGTFMLRTFSVGALMEKTLNNSIIYY